MALTRRSKQIGRFSSMFVGKSLFYIDTGARGKSVILMSLCSHILVLLITCSSSCWLVYNHALHSALEIRGDWLAKLLLPSQWLVWTPLFFYASLYLSSVCLCAVCLGLQEVWMQVSSKQSKPMQFTCFLWPIKRFLGLCWLRYASISCFALLCNIYVELHFIFVPALYGLFDSMKLIVERFYFLQRSKTCRSPALN